VCYLRLGADAVIANAGRCHVPVAGTNGRARGLTGKDARVIHTPPARPPLGITFRTGSRALSDSKTVVPAPAGDVNEAQPYGVALCFLSITES
jgi:hypothetical protein